MLIHLKVLIILHILLLIKYIIITIHFIFLRMGVQLLLNMYVIWVWVIFLLMIILINLIYRKVIKSLKVLILLLNLQNTVGINSLDNWLSKIFDHFSIFLCNNRLISSNKALIKRQQIKLAWLLVIWRFELILIAQFLGWCFHFIYDLRIAQVHHVSAIHSVQTLNKIIHFYIYQFRFPFLFLKVSIRLIVYTNLLVVILDFHLCLVDVLINIYLIIRILDINISSGWLLWVKATTHLLGKNLLVDLYNTFICTSSTWVIRLHLLTDLLVIPGVVLLQMLFI